MEIINFSILYCYVYTVQFGIHEKKARGCSKVMVDFTKNLFYNLQKLYTEAFFLVKKILSELIHDLTMTS